MARILVGGVVLSAVVGASVGACIGALAFSALVGRAVAARGRR